MEVLKMPVESLKKLPVKAQRMWESAYKAAKAKGLSPERAGKVAWGAVKKKYTKKADEWVSRGGAIISTKSIILRNFDTDGDTFVEAYVTSFEPDDGDSTTANGGESYMVSREAGIKIAKELESLKLGGGIEHDTFEGSKTYDEDADDVWTVIKADVDNEGVKALFKLNKKSKRYQEVLDGINRKKYRGASLEIIASNSGMKLKKVGNRYVNEIVDFKRIVGVTLTRSPLDKKARIKATYTSKKK